MRGQRVIVDADLALLYGVTTRQLNQQVKRNSARFPADLALRLRAAEKEEVVTKCDHLRGLKYSPRAIEVGLFVVRAFVRMRKVVASHRALAKRLDELESKVGTHDRPIGQILAAIRQLSAPPAAPPHRLPVAKLPAIKRGTAGRPLKITP